MWWPLFILFIPVAMLAPGAFVQLTLIAKRLQEIAELLRALDARLPPRHETSK